MASAACISSPPSPSPCSWLSNSTSPRISFSRDLAIATTMESETTVVQDLISFEDFEFRLVDPVKKMLAADELFSDGILVPADQLKKMKEEEKDCEEEEGEKIVISEIFDKDKDKEDLCTNEFSPKAPRCSSKWKEFLGFKKGSNHQILGKNQDIALSTSSSKSLKNFLRRNSKLSSISTSSSSSSNELMSSMNLPLLKDLDSELVSISSRISLSSSSSSNHDHEDFPRLSLDLEKSNLPKVNLTKSKMRTKAKLATSRSLSSRGTGNAGGRVGRSATRRAPDSNSSSRGVSVDSPRMNSSGKVVFHGLERSSSSPSSFNGGPKMKARGMERSYSANVRIRPVLNVPVCTLRGSSSSSSKSGSVFGFGQLFSSSSSQKRDRGIRNQSIKKNGSESNR
ncbi:serine/arginine repetitive matrix-like protein [Thalictrum thalictroides]|uniref:Serine/arginine repetitive matrix-like protein n=1 Tax=Thalictrum thalictroides TaxID=46969 RepID=A0A7J6WR52_THATH|nr:serine/arginine repetitive matrix-like protein [Thalictrum thalictroides]